jgi:hypothetical protein
MPRNRPVPAGTDAYVRRRHETRPETPLVSFVVPVINEEDVIDPFLNDTGAVLDPLGLPYEYVFIDADRQDPPDLIPRILGGWRAGSNRRPSGPHGGGRIPGKAA